jgi:uncharacterized protein YjbI with pentapeptide repeats
MADVMSTQLKGANLRYASMQGTEFKGTLQQPVDLSGIQAQAANFRGADFMSVKMTGARLESADFSNVRGPVPPLTPRPPPRRTPLPRACNKRACTSLLPPAPRCATHTLRVRPAGPRDRFGLLRRRLHRWQRSRDQLRYGKSLPCATLHPSATPHALPSTPFVSQVVAMRADFTGVQMVGAAVDMSDFRYAKFNSVR